MLSLGYKFILNGSQLYLSPRLLTSLQYLFLTKSTVGYFPNDVMIPSTPPKLPIVIYWTGTDLIRFNILSVHVLLKPFINGTTYRFTFPICSHSTLINKQAYWSLFS